MIYGTLTELSNTVHALALHTYTIKEWEGYRIRFCLAALPGGKHRVEIAFATAGAFPVCCVQIYKNGLRAVLFCLKMRESAFADKFERKCEKCRSSAATRSRLTKVMPL
jgi:hypothetical protein